jgi:hypothetical protein
MTTTTRFRPSNKQEAIRQMRAITLGSLATERLAFAELIVLVESAKVIPNCGVAKTSLE